MKIIKNKSGFTLFELLISITIGSVLLGIILATYNLTIKSLSNSETRAELSQNSRTVVDRISRDIRQAKSIATILPATKNDPSNPPPNEIEIQDGHQTNNIQYIRYYLDGTNLKRQTLKYYFTIEPDISVSFDAEDEFGYPPETKITEDELVGQYFEEILFYGMDHITIEILLSKSKVEHKTKTAVSGRNF
jgi:prepilin-type N-terminal cleavage/methylation domain-containing protein